MAAAGENLPRVEFPLRMMERAALPFLVLLSAAVGFWSLGHYDHNDHLNAVAPVVARDHRLYSDFAYDQTPLSVLVSVAIGRFVADRHLYTVLRIYSLLLNCSTLLIGAIVCWRAAANRIFALFLFAVLFLSFGPTETIGGEIGNYTLALFLFALSLLAFDASRTSQFATLLVGIFAGLAVSTKLSYVFVLAAYGILYLTLERISGRFFRRAAMFGAGAVIGLAPAIFYAVTDYDAFVFENIHVHYLQNVYRGLASVPQSSNLLIFSIESAAIPLVLAGMVGVAGFLVWRVTRERATPSSAKALYPTHLELALLCLAAAALVGAVTPAIVFPQYLAAPGFLIFLCVALYLDRLLAIWPRSDALSDRLRLGAISAMVVLGLLRGIFLLQESVSWMASGEYGFVAVATMRDRLSRVIAGIDRHQPICHDDLVSAFADLAVGAGARISPVSATGPFIIRLDSVFAERAPAFRRFSDVTRYLTPRSLILSGFYNDDSYEPKSGFQNVMENYAHAHHFQAIGLGTFMHRPISLYVPPECVAPA